MPETLLLRPATSADAPHCWAITDTAAPAFVGTGTGDDAALAAAASQRRVVLLLPSSAVLSVQLALPARTLGKALQVAPFALEEQLACDIESQHVAVAAAATAGLWQVQVTDRSQLMALLAKTDAAGAAASAVHAESSLVPVLEGHVTVLLEGACWVLRSMGQAPFVMVSDDAAEVLALALSAWGLSAADFHLTVYCEPADWTVAADRIQAAAAQAGFLSCHGQLLAQGALPFLASHHAQSRALDLLQGELARRTPLSTQWRAWRSAAVLVAVALLLALASEVLSLRRLAAEEQLLDERIAAAWAPLGQGEVPPADLQQRLLQWAARAQSGGAAAPGLLPALAALPVSANGELRLRSAQYKSGVLDLEVAVANAEALQALAQALTATGQASQVISGGQVDERYVGRLRITGESR